jgi:hypothetical protein
VLLVAAVEGGFSVSVSPPDAADEWSSVRPLTPTEVLASLGRLGCHSTAISDALDATGVDWRPVHDAEVRRRRAAE